jgi:hypothetical protein
MSKTNLIALPLNGLAPNNTAIAAHLREQADWVEKGDHGNVTQIVMLIESDDSLFRQCFGETIDRSRVIGLLTIMAARMATGTDK